MHPGEQADPAIGPGTRLRQQLMSRHLDVEASQHVRHRRKCDTALNQQPDQRAQQAPHGPEQHVGLERERRCLGHLLGSAGAFDGQHKRMWDICPHIG